jgi:hypothetical protein
MFITQKSGGYDRHDQAFSSGKFLLFMQPNDEWEKYRTFGREKIRCLVRSCALRQLGHWMMGTVRIKGKSITVSGAYGSDGLPKSVPREIWELGVELPQDLYDKWAKGGGWNSAGSEAAEVREWARNTFK